MQKRSNGKISFNFTDKQQERFTLLYAETKRLHPELTEDIMAEKTKVILANYIINEEKYDDENCKQFEECITLTD